MSVMARQAPKEKQEQPVRLAQQVLKVLRVSKVKLVLKVHKELKAKLVRRVRQVPQVRPEQRALQVLTVSAGGRRLSERSLQMTNSIKP